MLSTRARVAALTPGLSCRARSTVPIEMPRARAMSLMPAAGAVGGRVFASDDMRLDLSELARNCVPGSYRRRCRLGGIRSARGCQESAVAQPLRPAQRE